MNLRTAALVLGLCSLSGPAAAAELEGFAYGAGEFYARGDQPGGHGIALLGAQLDQFHGSTQLQAILNTDTLHLGFDQLELGEDWWAGATISGEYRFAGLLTDYHVRGELQPERGFAASYLGGMAHVSTRRESNLFIRLEWTARRFYFAELEDTASGYVLPPTTTIHSPRMYVTWWGFEHDPSHDDWHRPFMRRDGFGFGASFGIDARDRAARWGDLTTRRNAPGAYSAVAAQWFAFGVEFGERFRFEAHQEGGIMTDADDMTRRRIGGMNPYVVLVSGAPWASHLASRWVAGDVAQRVQFGSMEVGARLDAAWVDDRDRSGDGDAGTLVGAALELDWRPEEIWQVDARLGFSPQTGAWENTPHVGAYVGVGRSF